MKYPLRPWTEAPKVQQISDIRSILEKHYGITSDAQQRFFSPTMADLHSPWLLKDMDKAIQRIITAIQKDERIMVFGDFDADGITSTAQLYTGLRKMGAKVSYRIPDRMKDSHGLKNYLIDDIAEAGVTLIITCDCGINDSAEVAYAAKQGIEVIITDHHTPDPTRRPGAYAIVNPHQSECAYPYKDISGSVVAFKLLHALAERGLPNEDAVRAFLVPYFELATIGLIADCMPLVDENRTLSQFGLSLLQNTSWPSLNTIFIQSNIQPGQRDEQTIGFVIAPLLNAASRLNHANQALKLFTNSGKALTQAIANLQALNEQRKTLTEQYQKQAETMIDTTKPCQVLVHKDWHPGILGLIAGRVAEQIQQPVIAVTYEDKKKTPEETLCGASCRAPEGYNMAEALQSVGEHMLHYGGHAGAAGFRCCLSQLDTITRELEEHFTQQENTAKKPHRTVAAEILPSMLIGDLALTLRPFKPFGERHSTPLFLVRGGVLTDIQMVGAQQNHAQVFFQWQTKTGTIDQKIMGFFMSDLPNKLILNKPYDILIEVSDQWWQGEHKLQIKLVDIQPT